MIDTFNDAFAATVGEEGTFGKDPRDKGNWTGGKIGVGELRGTKYGISAASYPTIDIVNLTLADARAIYLRDFWRVLRCDSMPTPLDRLLFDFGVNSGVGGGAIGLQRALEVKADGAIGPQTLKAVALQHNRMADFLDEFQAERLLYMSEAGGWPTYRRGWARRVLRLHRRYAGAVA